MITKSFKDLIVWQKSLELTEEIYRVTAKLPREELYGLTSQMRRAAVSIASNIAEGRMRSTAKDFSQFLRIAYGSAAELETQLLLANRLFLIGESQKTFNLLEEVQKMLATMISRLRA